jgi:hypothetical protein
MKRIIPAALFCTLVVSLVLSCSSSKQGISLVGEKGEISDLTGMWRGTYDSDDGTRTGTIELNIAKDAKTATGSVIMRMSDNPDMPLRLAIRFVQIAEGWVSGRLDPYEDPDCNCLVESLFQGRLSGDSMVGTYSTRGVAEEFLRTGSWLMTRDSTDTSPADSNTQKS